MHVPRAPELYSPTGKVVPRGSEVGNVGIIMNGSFTKDYQFINIK